MTVTARPPWERTESQSLAREIRDLLAQLSIISEAGTLRLVSFTTHGENEQDGPPGYDPHRSWTDTAEPPDLKFSLYEHFAWQFTHAADDRELRQIVCAARVQLRARRHGLSPKRIAGDLNRNSHGRETQEEIEARDTTMILQTCEGVASAEIAAEFNLPIGWVETVRQRNARDPEFGRQRPAFREAADDERRRIVSALHQDGLDQRSAARLLGVSHGTVGRYWPKRQAA